MFLEVIVRGTLRWCLDRVKKEIEVGDMIRWKIYVLKDWGLDLDL